MISPTLTNTAATTGATAAATPQASSVLSSDFETFIKMLTTQARYQDPLEPIDSSEYAAQLAQFSMVEQQVLSNDLLTGLRSELGGGNIGQLAGWIGMEARSSQPASFSGTPITVEAKRALGADAAVLNVVNSNGTTVQRLTLPVGETQVQWAGVKSDGSAFPAGAYTFSVESSAKGEVLSTSPAQSYSRVTEIRQEGVNTVLVLEGGVTAQTSDVTGLREGV